MSSENLESVDDYQQGAAMQILESKWFLRHDANLDTKIMQEEVLADLHAGALYGHLGPDKTLAHLKEHFYWPWHYNDVCDWCQNCSSCVFQKTRETRPYVPLQSTNTGYPLQLVAMDISGLFPESPAGNMHILVVTSHDGLRPTQFLIRRGQQ